MNRQRDDTEPSQTAQTHEYINTQRHIQEQLVYRQPVEASLPSYKNRMVDVWYTVLHGLVVADGSVRLYGL